VPERGQLQVCIYILYILFDALTVLQRSKRRPLRPSRIFRQMRRSTMHESRNTCSTSTRCCVLCVHSKEHLPPPLAFVSLLLPHLIPLAQQCHLQYLQSVQRQHLLVTTFPGCRLKVLKSLAHPEQAPDIPRLKVSHFTT
jgi:hypothetical protein